MLLVVFLLTLRKYDIASANASDTNVPTTKKKQHCIQVRVVKQPTSPTNEEAKFQAEYNTINLLQMVKLSFKQNTNNE